MGVLGLAFGTAGATPIPLSPASKVARPPVQIDFAPARAGWNGPETQVLTPRNNTYLAFKAVQAQRARVAARDLFMPDLRLWLALLVTIVGGRTMLSRRRPQARGRLLAFPERTKMPRAA